MTTKIRFDVYWLGEVTDGKENFGHTVASSSTLKGARSFAKMKKITDFSHTIYEVHETLPGLEDIVTEHRIKQ